MKEKKKAAHHLPVKHNPLLHTGKEKQPEYTVQISDPKMLRKDLLESLREIIIFMQGYESFRKMQEEKVATFAVLKNQVRQLNSLIDNKLKRYLPKGKLRPLNPDKMEKEEAEETAEPEEKVETSHHRVPRDERVPVGELEELEDQLKDIEDQLKGI